MALTHPLYRSPLAQVLKKSTRLTAGSTLSVRLRAAAEISVVGTAP